MIKAQERLNGCWARAQENELVFVLLERDHSAPVAIRAWVAHRVETGKNEAGDSQITEAIECAAQMETHADVKRARQRPGPDTLWQILRSAGVTLPEDITRIIIDARVGNVVQVYYQCYAQHEVFGAGLDILAAGFTELPGTKLKREDQQ